MLARGAFRDRSVVELSEQFVCILVDVRQEGKTADRFRVRATPTVSLLAPGATTQRMMVGPQSSEEYLREMRKML
jgi:thioredoxin-like negative regulator of GroEL